MARQFTRFNCAAIIIASATALSAVLVFVLPNSACRRLVVPVDAVGASGKISTPVARTLPRRFPRNTNLPLGKESLTSGPIDLATFNPTQDLVRFQSPTVWFESDYDKVRVEDDHLVHRSIVAPLERLVRLVNGNGGRLKIHEAYRCAGVHKSKSLHREGRSLDLTCEKLSLSELAKLCWVAGFDWVLYEHPRGGGDHVHCSVKR
jgi:hypothetical protein